MKVMQPQVEEEIGEAKVRARQLRSRGVSPYTIARRMASEFFVCIHASRNKVWASYIHNDRTVIVPLA